MLRQDPCYNSKVLRTTLIAHHNHKNNKKILADGGFDPRTSGLREQHASTAPLCLLLTVYQRILLAKLLEKNSP